MLVAAWRGEAGCKTLASSAPTRRRWAGCRCRPASGPRKGSQGGRVEGGLELAISDGGGIGLRPPGGLKPVGDGTADILRRVLLEEM